MSVACSLFPLFCIVPHLVVVPLHALDTCLQTASQTDGRASTIKEDEEKYKHSIENTIQHHMFIYSAIEKRRSRDILSPEFLLHDDNIMIDSRVHSYPENNENIFKSVHGSSFRLIRVLALSRSEGRTDGRMGGRPIPSSRDLRWPPVLTPPELFTAWLPLLSRLGTADRRHLIS